MAEFDWIVIFQPDSDCPRELSDDVLDSNKASLKQLTEEHLVAVDGDDDQWALVRALTLRKP